MTDQTLDVLLEAVHDIGFLLGEIMRDSGYKPQGTMRKDLTAINAKVDALIAQRTGPRDDEPRRKT